MGSKLSGGMGMSRVGTRLVGGVMSGHRNSIDRSGKIEAYYYELGLILFNLLHIISNIFLISYLLHKGGVEGVLSHFGASAKATTDRNNRTRKTTTKWRTCEPDFHEQFTYSVPSRSIADLEKLNLHISVWDKENGRPDEYIGRE